MKRITDVCILLVYCLAAVFFVPPGTAFVAAFLSALIYSSVCLLRIPKIWQVILTVVYVGMGAVYTEFILFLPLILYGVLEYRNNLLAFLCLAAGLGTYFYGGAEIAVFLLLGSGISAVFQYQTSRYEELCREFRKLRDDSAERNIELKEKNKNLMDKQDYEIYAATLRDSRQCGAYAVPGNPDGWRYESRRNERAGGGSRGVCAVSGRDAE